MLLRTLYRPRSFPFPPEPESETEPVLIFGLNKHDRQDFGMSLYHNGRLIKFNQRVGIQLNASSQGIGVIGVVTITVEYSQPLQVQANHLEPTHNKQDFKEDVMYHELIAKLATKLNTYWYYIRYFFTESERNDVLPKTEGRITALWKQLAVAAEEGPYWVQCSNCLKWRKLEEDFQGDDDVRDLLFYINFCSGIAT